MVLSMLPRNGSKHPQKERAGDRNQRQRERARERGRNRNAFESSFPKSSSAISATFSLSAVSHRSWPIFKRGELEPAFQWRNAKECMEKLRNHHIT